MFDAFSRREFLRRALAAGTAVPAVAQRFAKPVLAEERRSPNEKLNLAVIGVANRGRANLDAVSGENIVALCDIDQHHLASAAEVHPHAARFDDFRRVFDLPNLDGVVVATPDHMHAIPVALALRQGLAVYCEKPLTHSIHEVRTISRLTEESGAVTQMGNQIHNHPENNYRRVVEWIQAGIIGPVERVHVWQGGGVRTGKRVVDGHPPDFVNYDLWLGPAPYRPFHESHFHFNWRYWWDFGGGQLADFVCHYMDLPYWALGLDYPTAITARGEKGHDGDNDCPNYLQVDYQFPARGEQPPVHVTWYHGGWKPAGAELYGKDSAVLFEGTKGRVLADYTTRNVYMRNVYMESGESAPDVPKSIPDTIGHHAEWLAAIRSGNPQTTCNFRYGALLTEAGHLGNISYRLGGRTLEWDAENARAANCPEADGLIRREYRKGWTL